MDDDLDVSMTDDLYGSPPPATGGAVDLMDPSALLDGIDGLDLSLDTDELMFAPEEHASNSTHFADPATGLGPPSVPVLSAPGWADFMQSTAPPFSTFDGSTAGQGGVAVKSEPLAPGASGMGDWMDEVKVAPSHVEVDMRPPTAQVAVASHRAEPVSPQTQEHLANFRTAFRTGNKDAAINVAVRELRLPFGQVLNVLWGCKPRLQRRNIKTHPMRLLRCLLRAYNTRGSDSLYSQYLSSPHHFRNFLKAGPNPGTRLIGLVQGLLKPAERIPNQIAQDLELLFNVLQDNASPDPNSLTVEDAVDTMFCTKCEELMCYRGCRVRHADKGKSKSGKSSKKRPARPAGNELSPGSTMRSKKRPRSISRPSSASRPSVAVAGDPAAWVKPPVVAYTAYDGATDMDVELLGKTKGAKCWQPPTARLQACPMHYDALLWVGGEAPPLDETDPHMTVDVFTKGKRGMLPALTFDINFEGGAADGRTGVKVPDSRGGMDGTSAPSAPASNHGPDAAAGAKLPPSAPRRNAWPRWGGDPLVSNSTYRVFRTLCCSGVHFIREAACTTSGQELEASREMCVALCRAMYCVAIARYDPAAFWDSVVDDDGVTLLHVAAALGCEHVVNTMLQSGADSTKKCLGNTTTAADLAERNGYAEIAETLREEAELSDESTQSATVRPAAATPLNCIGRELLHLFRCSLAAMRQVAVPRSESVASTPAGGEMTSSVRTASVVLCRQLVRGMAMLSAAFEGDHAFLWGRIATEQHGWRLIHAAAALGDTATVLSLSNLGADLWVEGQDGLAHHVASQFGHTKVSAFLQVYRPTAAQLARAAGSGEGEGEGAGEVDDVMTPYGSPTDAIYSSGHSPVQSARHTYGTAAGGTSYGTDVKTKPIFDSSMSVRSGRSGRSGKNSHASSRGGRSSVDDLRMGQYRKSSLAFIAMVLLGVAMLLPWNMIVFSIDYFNNHYPDSSFEFIASICYVLPQLPVAIYMLKNAEKWSVTPRLSTSLLFQAASMLAVPEVCHYAPQRFQMYLVMAAIFVCGLASQVTISSVLGLAAQLPPACMQAVMVGLGAAGLLGPMARIAVKAGVHDVETSALAYYGMAAGFVVVAMATFLVLSQTPFTVYHMRKAQNRQASNTILTPSRRVWAPLIADVEQSSAGGVAEHGSWAHFSLLSGKVWAYSASATLVFFTTFALWPGQMTNIPYRGSWHAMDALGGEWWPIVLLTVFNVFDLGARCFKPSSYQLSEPTMLFASIVRAIVFMPLFVYTTANFAHLFSDLFVLGMVAVFAATNGYLATVALQCAPGKSSSRDRESMGFYMTLFLQCGSVIGSLSALAIDKF